MNSRAFCGLMVALLAGSVVSQSLAETRYTLVDLGPGAAKDVNSSGKVVGNADTGGWYFNGTNRNTVKFGARFLGGPLDQVLFFTALSANGINDDGRIVGSVIFVPLQFDTQTPYYYDGGEVATLLAQGDAHGVNGSGAIVGGTGPAFIFNGTSVSTPPGPAPKLYALNDSGLAVGSVAPGSIDLAASFKGNTHKVLDLENLNLPALGIGAFYESSARSVNVGGDIVGQVKLNSGAPIPKPTWAFVFASNKAVDLGTLGGITATAHDINGDGVIVGSSTIEDGSPHAFVHVDGAMADLNLRVNGAFGWVLKSANAVNDAGFIVGEGTKNGAQHAFLLRPVVDAQPPLISAQPLGVSVFTNASFTLSVTASGTGPITYQWRHANTNLPGATSRTLTVAQASASDAGSYRVVVSNAFGSVTSNEAMIQVSVGGGDVPDLSVALYAGIKITGTTGQKVRIEAVEDAGSSNWQPLDTITIETSPYTWVDPASPQHARRLYRGVPVP
jgi:probable HAF family extracellular repeat protein